MMNGKEVLFFVGKCLTIKHEEYNKILVEDILKSNTVPWPLVVTLSTSQFVFPTLYCNLKSANFLRYLPEELVVFMRQITDENRERNQKIIAQAKEINELLLKNGITPIFLKGTGNLLEGLYDDVAERMVGDIDLIVSKENATKAYRILREQEYVSKSDLKFYLEREKRHIPPLTNKNKIAAVEIHIELLIKKHRAEFNYSIVQKKSQKINNINFLSFKHQIALSIIAEQINDGGFRYNTIVLRNAYDVFLLSKKTEAKTSFDEFKSLKNPLNCFLATCFQVFNSPPSLQYKATNKTEAYLKIFNEDLNNEEFRKKRHREVKIKFSIKSKINTLFRSFFDAYTRKIAIRNVIHRFKARKHGNFNSF